MTGHASTQSERSDISYYIHVCIMLLWMFGFQFISPIEPLTHQGMQAVGIFMGLLWAWTFVDFIWPSLLGMVAVGYTGFMTVDKAFSTGFGNTTVIMIACIFTLAAFMTSTGICKTVAYWFISRKNCVGKPYIFMLYFFTAMYILGGTAGTVAAYVIGWAIVYSVAELLGYKQGDPFPAVLLVGTVLSAMLGATVFPFRAFAVMVLNNAKELVGLECSFIEWAIPSFFASFSALLLYILAVKFIFRPDTSKLEHAGDVFVEFRNSLELTKEQKVAMGLMLAIIVFASIPGFLPPGNPVKVRMANLSIGPLVAIALGILYAIHKQGKPMIDYVSHIKNGIDWQTIIMLAASFPVAAMIQSPDSGVTTLINEFLTRILGSYSPFILACIFIIFTAIVTQVAHNLVMVIVLGPIICNLSLALGFNPMPCLMMLAFAANTGIATAGASVMGAMLFANRSWIPTGQCFKYTWVGVFACILGMVLLGIPLATIMGAGTPIAP